MAEPGRRDLIPSVLRPRRRAARGEARSRVRNLERERESAYGRSEAVVRDAALLAHGVDATDRALVAAADEFGDRARRAAEGAFGAFANTVDTQTKTLRELRSRGTGRDLEAALQRVEPVMEPARQTFSEELGAASAIVREAKESLGTSTDRHAPARPTLHGPPLTTRSNDAAGRSRTTQGRLRGSARDTLRAAISAQRRLGPSEHGNRTRK